MPSRSTIITGQHPEHAWCVDERCRPSGRRAFGRRGAARARLPHGADRQAALRAVPRPVRPLHREPLRPRTSLVGLCTAGSSTSSTATHGAVGPLHYARWLAAEPPRGRRRCSTPCSTRPWRSMPQGGGDTGAPQVHDNAVPREWYHTDWVADRTIAWLDSLAAEDDWFCWMSFPDPHHPWDPPASELGRVDWRDLPLPDGYIEDAGRAREPSSTPSPALAGRGTTAASSPTTRRPPTGFPPP